MTNYVECPIAQGRCLHQPSTTGDGSGTVCKFYHPDEEKCIVLDTLVEFRNVLVLIKERVLYDIPHGSIANLLNKLY